jgi:hypothetical protein
MTNKALGTNKTATYLMIYTEERSGQNLLDYL